MRLLSVKAFNFGSYKHFSFDFKNLGLSLVYGPTGSGKSTIQDIPCWVLFGHTSKGGSVDEVRSWDSEDPTTGIVEVETPSGIIKVTRIRGQAHETDLFYDKGNVAGSIRGKDISSTQKQICMVLGVSEYEYINSSYFHEFSSCANFFRSSAKDRRSVVESLVDLSLPATIAEKSSNERKRIKRQYDAIKNEHSNLQGIIEGFEYTIINSKKEIEIWDFKQKKLLKEISEQIGKFYSDSQLQISILHKKFKEFESTRKSSILALQWELESLSQKIQPESYFLEGTVCPTCGGQDPKKVKEKSENDKILLKIEHIKEKISDLESGNNHYADDIARIRSTPNPYHQRLDYETSRKNPFLESHSRVENQLKDNKEKLDRLSETLSQLSLKLSKLDILYDLSPVLRGKLLGGAVEFLESETNRLLQTYFDSEFRVGFSLDDDKIEVLIYKDNYECVYTQLSKGQRGLLRLCFVVSVMKAAANKIGTHFSTLFFDEALDGLDSDLKIKSFRLFSELAQTHESILLIDHAPEFQNLFDRKFKVSIPSNHSVVEEE